MKKAFAGVMAGALVAAMCAWCAACGEGGKVDTESIESAEVTEEQWDTAFDAVESAAQFADDAAFTLDMGITAEYAGTVHHFAAEYGGTWVANGGRGHIKVDVLSEEGSMPEVSWAENVDHHQSFAGDYYYEATEGDVQEVYFVNEEGEWECSDRGPNVILFSTMLPIRAIDAIRYAGFDSFCYDAEQKGYVLKDPVLDWEEMPDRPIDYFKDVVVKFGEDGKLAALSFLSFYEYGFEEEDGTIVGVDIGWQGVFTYTAEEIEFPTVE